MQYNLIKPMCACELFNCNKMVKTKTLEASCFFKFCGCKTARIIITCATQHEPLLNNTPLCLFNSVVMAILVQGDQTKCAPR